jgi:hypothetical protein
LNLIEIADLIYNNANQVSFGSREQWDLNTFKSQWYLNLNQPQPNSNGLYWFLTDTDLTIFERPITLPKNGCDYSLVANYNINTFTSSLLSPVNKEGLIVVYNGHESNVMNRVRAHFSLSNHRTGALGIKHYNNSDKNWILRYFTIKDIDCLEIDEIQQEVILNLLKSKTGRVALENAWRIKNGWPKLCKA